MAEGRNRALAAVGFALAAVVAVPVLFLLFRGWGLGGAAAKATFASSATWWAFGRTLLLAGLVALLSAAIALPLAWLTHATDVPGRRWFRVLLVLPLAVPSYVGGFVVILLFAPTSTGGFNIYGLPGTVLALLFTYPLVLLTVQGALARLDPRLWESALSLGHSPTSAFVRVILPSLRPALWSGALLVALYAVGDFGAVSLLNYEALSTLIYNRQKSLFDRDEAVFLSLLLIIVASLLVWAFARAGGRTHRDVRSAPRPWPTVRLGRWKTPAFLFASSVFIAGVGLPLGVVGYWLFRGLDRDAAIEVPWADAGRSLAVGAIAAALIVSLAFVPTVLSHFGKKRMRWLSWVADMGYALPGIVVALSFVALAAQWVPVLYQTIALLLCAYVVRFLPLAVHSIDESVAAQEQGPYWAARSLGLTKAKALLRVVVPQARPALFVAYFAVFLAVIKELPATLLLSPTDYSALSTKIWLLTEDAFLAQASAAVLLLLGLAISVLLIRPDIRRRAK